MVTRASDPAAGTAGRGAATLNDMPEPLFISLPPSTATPRPPTRRRRRWPWVVGAVVLALVAGAGVVWLTSNRAVPVSLGQAESRYHGPGSAATGDSRPAPGVYRYTGSGSEKLSMPPLSQVEGPSMPGTVTLQGANCFVFRIDYSTHHWQTWRYCLHHGDLWEAGGQSWQLWSIGPLQITNLSSFTCVAGSMALPGSAEVGQAWRSSCTGTNTSVRGKTSSTGPYRFLGLTTLSVGGQSVRAAHFLRLRTDAGAQRGTERSEVWVNAGTGLPLRVDQTIKVTSPTPFGTSSYTQVGTFRLTSPVAHR